MLSAGQLVVLVAGGSSRGEAGQPLTAARAPQPFSPFPVERLECGQLAHWRASPPSDTAGPPEPQLHPEGGELLYPPPYGLPFSYRYGHCPLDPHVFGGKKPVLPAKLGPQGSPCEVARFFLSECQWHYANPLVPGSPAPAKTLSEPPPNTARHSLVPNYEGGSLGHGGWGVGLQTVGGGWQMERDPHSVGAAPFPLLSGDRCAFPLSVQAPPVGLRRRLACAGGR